MKDFTDIYRFFTKKYLTGKSNWEPEEIKEVKELIHDVTSDIEHGELLARSWMMHLETQNVTHLITGIKNVIRGLLDLESIIQKEKTTENEPVHEKPRVHVETPAGEPQTQDDQEDKYLSLYPPDQILAQYGTMSIYKPVVDAIQEQLHDRFSVKTLKDFIHKFYVKNINSKISGTSISTYTGKYARYLVENKLYDVEWVGKQKYLGRTTTVLTSIVDNDDHPVTVVQPDPIVNRSEHAGKSMQVPVLLADGETLSEAIYNFALRSGWADMRNLPTITVERRFPNFTSEEIKEALGHLISEGKAFQTHPPDRIKFKKT